MSHYATSQSSPSQSIIPGLEPLLRLDTGGAILLCLLITAIFSTGARKGKLVFARTAGRSEKLTALAVAEKQVKERARNKVTLYCGTPRSTGLNARLSTLLGTFPSLPVPDIQEGCAVCGGPGKGKTFSVLDQLIRNALDQNIATIVYDFKGEQLRRHAAHAAALGYEVYVYAPGKPYSGVVNPLDFIRDAGDSVRAKQLAMVINRNAQSNPSAKQDEFFAKASDLLVQTVLMLAKSSSHQDVLMAWELLSLPDVARRFKTARDEQRIDLWAEITAASITSVADAEQTVGGIVSTAVNTFANFIARDFAPSICGKTNIPLKLAGKQVLFLQLDQETRDVVSPLLATILNLFITKNMSEPRSCPLAFIADELPTLYIPDLVKWINEYRENGLITIIGYQNFAQLEAKYGEKGAQSILAACATKFIFNPQDQVTAEKLSKYFGEEEVVIKTRSRTHGKNSSHSQSEQYHKRWLFDATTLLKLPKGTCIFVNPAYAGGGEAALPMKLKVKISTKDLAAQAKSESLWDTKVCNRLIKRASKSQLSLDEQQLREEFIVRRKLANLLFPDGNEDDYIEFPPLEEESAESQPDTVIEVV